MDIDVVNIAGKEYEWKRFSQYSGAIYDRWGSRNLIHNIYLEPDLTSLTCTTDYLGYMYASHLNQDNLSYMFELIDYVTKSNGFLE